MIKLLRSFVSIFQTLSLAFMLLVGAGALPASAWVSDPLSSMDFWSSDGSALDSDTQRYMSEQLGEYIATAAGAIGGGVGAGKVGFRPKPGSSDEASVKPDVETSGGGNNSPPVEGGSLGKPDYDLPNGYSQRPDGSVVNNSTGAVYTPTGKYTQDGKPIFNTESAGTTSQTTLTNPASSNPTINLGEINGGVNGLPDNPSQLGHIFGNRRGHLPDTPENRQLLVDTSNNPANNLGTNRFGNDVHVSTKSDGSQVWVETRNGIIQNGGVNNPPRTWVDGEGLR